VSLSDVELGFGHAQKAARLANRSIAILSGKPAGEDAWALADAQVSLARARWELNERSEALSLARQARASFSALKDVHPDEVRELTDWLKAHSVR
jgi:hypothetical protein